MIISSVNPNSLGFLNSFNGAIQCNQPRVVSIRIKEILDNPDNDFIKRYQVNLTNIIEQNKLDYAQSLIINNYSVYDIYDPENSLFAGGLGCLIGFDNGFVAGTPEVQSPGFAITAWRPILANNPPIINFDFYKIATSTPLEFVNAEIYICNFSLPPYDSVWTTPGEFI